MKTKIIIKKINIFLVVFALIFTFGIIKVSANCCGGTPDGYWLTPDCCWGCGSWTLPGPCPAACCSPRATLCPIIVPCEGPECDDDDDDEPGEECSRCSLPNCPNPPLSETGIDQYKLTDFYTCSDSGPCSPPTDHSIDCFEVPSAQPSTSLVINPESVPTTYGFVSSTYTGNGRGEDSVNEPINMVATYTDTTGSEIEAVYVWFKKGTANPLTPRFIDLDNSSSAQSRKTPSNSQFGFVMAKVGGYWFPYIPGIEGAGDSPGDRWLQTSYFDNTFYIPGPWGNFIVSVKINSINVTATSVVMNFDVSFDQMYGTVDDGAYNIFLMANDRFSFTPYDNYTAYPEVDARIRDLWGPEEIRLTTHWANRGTWNVDKTPPQVTSINVSVEDNTKLRFTWNVADNIGIYGTVGNLYIDNNFENVQPFYTTVSPVGTNTVVSPYTPHVLGDSKVGHLTNDLLFKKIGNYTTGYAILDVRDNREGYIFLHITTFDRGGNPAQYSASFDLRDWMITKGGLLFSDAGVDVTIRTINNGLWSSIPLLNTVYPNQESRADITSELLGDKLTTTPPPAPEKSATVGSYAIRPYPITNTASYYSTLRPAFDRRVQLLNATELTPPPSGILTGNMTPTSNPSIRYMYVDNLIVGTPDPTTGYFNCNGKGIFFVSGNLTINGRIINSNANSNACIFVVKGNTIVKPGQFMSGSALRYDPLNAYILMDGQITVEKEVTTNSRIDGLYVSGGIHTLQGITVQRYLGLTHRLQYPVFVVNHHSKYGVFAGQLFGSQVNIQKTEVGLKPY